MLGKLRIFLHGEIAVVEIVLGKLRWGNDLTNIKSSESESTGSTEVGVAVTNNIHLVRPNLTMIPIENEISNLEESGIFRLVEITMTSRFARDKKAKTSLVENLSKFCTPYKVTNEEKIVIENTHEVESMAVMEKISELKVATAVLKSTSIKQEQAVINDSVLLYQSIDRKQYLLVGVGLDIISASSVTEGLGESPISISFYSRGVNFHLPVPPLSILKDQKKKSLLLQLDSDLNKYNNEKICNAVLETYLETVNKLLIKNLKEKGLFDHCIFVFESWHQASVFFNWVGFSKNHDYLKNDARIISLEELENTSEIKIPLDGAQNRSKFSHYVAENFVKKYKFDEIIKKSIRAPTLVPGGSIDLCTSLQNICYLSLEFVKHESRDVISQIGCIIVLPNNTRKTFFSACNPFRDEITKKQISLLKLISTESGLSFKDSVTGNLVPALIELEVIEQFLQFCKESTEQSSFKTTLVTFSSSVTLTVLLQALKKHSKSVEFFNIFRNYSDLFNILQKTYPEENILDIPRFVDICHFLKVEPAKDSALQAALTLQTCVNKLVNGRECDKIKGFSNTSSKLFLSGVKYSFCKLQHNLYIHPGVNTSVKLTSTLPNSRDLRVSESLIKACSVKNVSLIGKEISIELRNETKTSIFLKKDEKILRVYEALTPLCIPTYLDYDYSEVGSSLDTTQCFNKPMQSLIPRIIDSSELETECEVPKSTKYNILNFSLINLEPKSDQEIYAFIKELKLVPKISVSFQMKDLQGLKFFLTKDSCSLEICYGRLHLLVKNLTMKSQTIFKHTELGVVYCDIEDSGSSPASVASPRFLKVKEVKHEHEKTVSETKIKPGPQPTISAVPVQNTEQNVVQIEDSTNITELKPGPQPTISAVLVQNNVQNVVHMEDSTNITMLRHDSDAENSSKSSFPINTNHTRPVEKKTDLSKKNENENGTEKVHCNGLKLLVLTKYPEYEGFFSACNVYKSYKSLDLSDNELSKLILLVMPLSEIFTSFDHIIQEISDKEPLNAETIAKHFDSKTFDLFSEMIPDSKFCDILVHHIKLKKAKNLKDARAEEARENEAREKEARETEARETEARENEARENEARENEAREKEAKEKEAREKELSLIHI